MEQIIATIFSEKGIIYGLFALSFILAVWKGIPALFNLIFTQQAALQQAQHQLYKEELNNITQTFMQSITLSNEWHQSHSAELKKNSDTLEKISGILEKKYQVRSR
jgi:hypothetical protein